tara:strand:- start:471 stop:704 length:234 start_codon:yes stop_codon:yes gene_type:complete
MLFDKETLSQRMDFLEDELADLKQLVKVSFTGVTNELDDIQSFQQTQQKILGEITKIMDIHYEVIKKLERKNSKKLK